MKKFTVIFKSLTTGKNLSIVVRARDMHEAWYIAALALTTEEDPELELVGVQGGVLKAS